MADTVLQLSALDLPDHNGRNSAPALWLAISVLLHLVLFALLWLATVPDFSGEAGIDSGSRLELTLATPEPGQSVPDVTAGVSSLQSVPTQEEAVLPEALAAPETVVLETAGLPEASVETAPASPLTESETGQAGPTDRNSDETVSLISTGQLQQSVTAYVDNYRAELAVSTLADCQRYRNRHGVRECPQDQLELPADEEREVVAGMFRTWVTGHADNARESRKLQEAMDLMRPLLKTPGLVGELAQQRYYLAKDNYDYLDTGTATGEVVSLVYLDILGGKVILLSGKWTIDIKGRIEKDDKGRARSYRPYQLSARQEDEQKGEQDTENSFAVKAPLFPARR